MTYNAGNMWKFDDKESDSRHLQTRADGYTHSTSIYAEYDQPFDDFDRELLAEADTRHQFLVSRDSVVAYSPRRNACDSFQWHNKSLLQSSKLLCEDGAKVKRKTTTETGMLDLSDCTSSDTNMFSSPTVSMLRKKQIATNALNESISKSTKDYGIIQLQRRDGQSTRFNGSSGDTKQFQSPNMPEVRGIRLVPTSQLSDIQRSMFRFEWFNAVQSKCFPTAYETDDNLVVSAPTGSGKTVMMELAMLRLIHDMTKGNVKIVYLAPTKSLCNERCLDWHRKFNVFGIHCAELTGDTEYGDMQAAQNASIIVTTPEKWDSITRKWRDHTKLVRLVRLFLIDEVHVLGDARGATMEAIVSRMKCANHNIRFIALSATIPNSDDIAKWLTRSAQNRHLPAIREVFDDSFRPVVLKRHVLAYDGSYNPWPFENTLTEKVPDVVALHSKGKPVMIFCSTKESAQKTAVILAESRRVLPSNQSISNSTNERPTIVNELLRKVLRAGIAFHHASLSLADRKAVEQGFLDGDIDVICSTSTLAIGVNLPCYLVILKGTCGYSDNGLREYTSLEVMQMLGRAGRPQFEREACAVILCHKQHQKKYENVVAGEEIIESSLHQNLIEHLNAEISIGTIRNLESARQWLQSTFLYVRLQKNAEYYNMDPEQIYHGLDEALLAWCEKDLNLLQTAGLIDNYGEIKCTEYGGAMAKYCVKFDTMKTFMSLPTKAKMPDVLKALSSAAEFCGIRVKQMEKKMYKEINKANETRYPIDVDIALPQHKVSLIIQCKLSGRDVNKPGRPGNADKAESSTGQYRQLQADAHFVFDHCKRLIRCLVDVVVQKNDSIATKNALELARSLAAQAWDDTFLQLKQIQGIGDVLARKLAASGIRSVSALFNTEAHRIEIILSKNPPFGQNILEKASSFPLLHISVKELGRKHIRERGAEIKIRCEISFVSEKPSTTFNRRGFKVLFLCETPSGVLVDFRCFPARQLRKTQEFILTAVVREPASCLRCHTMCDDVAGTHCYAEIPLNCPDTWFPAKQTAPILVCEPVSHGGGGIVRDDWEEFGDEGLDDTTLLNAVETYSVEPTQDIYDIDDILIDPPEEDSKKCQKRRNSSLPSDEEEPVPSTVRLPNGNWTCRHSCRNRNLECKHICCKEGVKKKPSAKRRKKDTHSKLPSGTKHMQSTKNTTLKQTKAGPTIEDYLVGPNVHMKEEQPECRTSLPQSPTLETFRIIQPKFVLPNTITGEDSMVKTLFQDAHHNSTTIEERKLEEAAHQSTDIVATSVSDQESSPRFTFDSKKDSNTMIDTSQSNRKDDIAIGPLPRDGGGHTAEEGDHRSTQALKEIRRHVFEIDPPSIEQEAKADITSIDFGDGTTSELGDSSCFDRWFGASQVRTDKVHLHETEKKQSYTTQRRHDPNLVTKVPNLEQKRYWDDLESDFLTYNNFSFVTVVPD